MFTVRSNGGTQQVACYYRTAGWWIHSDSLNTVSGWKHGMMWSETEGEWRRIQFRTMESPAQEVAGALGLRIATRPGAKVEKIVEIKWMDERKDGPNGADIGGPDVQELWVMDSFAFALSGGQWSDKQGVARAIQAIKSNDYPSRTQIVMHVPMVNLVNFLYCQIICTNG